MTHDDQPKYGRRAEPPVEPAAGDWGHVPPTPEQIRRLREAVRDTRPTPEPRREPFGIVLASVLLVFGSALAGLAIFGGGWWGIMWVLAGPFILFGAVGLAHDIPKVPRDEHGRHLPR